MVDVDYEYLPPNPDAQPPVEDSSQLLSVYPDGTPAGLRGEAVRSALRSTQCIAWRLDGDLPSSLPCGWIRVKGKGTRDFLANKLTQTFSSDTNRANFVKACLLSPKGRLVDQISVAMVSPEEAYMLTSPGHVGQSLFDRLDPLIFPMDQVELENQSDDTFIFSVASTSIQHVHDAIQKYVEPLVLEELQDKSDWIFPSSSTAECLHVELQEDSSTLTIMPHLHLPTCACLGYTFALHGNSKLASALWRNMVGDQNPEGPVEVGPLEYETLRIEAGHPAYGSEFTADGKRIEKDQEKKKEAVPANPIELHWQDGYLDLEKGCYLGQEGIASVLKNPRGPARSLYSVVFEDDSNIYTYQSEGDKGDTPNLTVVPRAGSDLFVLGSNEQISLGTLTSVAEPGGTGDATIVALALVRRADSILKKMKEMDLEVGPSASTFMADDPLWTGNTLDKPTGDVSGIVQPPPLDSLDGLEVIVGGTYTVGTLKSIPSRRFLHGRNMFEDGVMVPDFDFEDTEGSVAVTRTSPRSDQEILDAMASNAVVPPGASYAENETNNDEEGEELEQAIEEAKKAEEEAEAAAAEAKRKSEKMEMLKRRAEEAMARRKKKKQ